MLWWIAAELSIESAVFIGSNIVANEYRKMPMNQTDMLGVDRATVCAVGSKNFIGVQKDVGTGESADASKWVAARNSALEVYSLSKRTFSARGPLGPWPTV
ncbi:hypothetical protein U8335_16970 [Roseiconus lacunae]|uniref:hypothetical protein n=1 Tax=Roseiconus lacunae TaxID=2605694 RepID=UPI003086DEF1|nr:hypothetical protein U8335_16970 [Stieleria sp. HD01]